MKCPCCGGEIEITFTEKIGTVSKAMLFSQLACKSCGTNFYINWGSSKANLEPQEFEEYEYDFSPTVERNQMWQVIYKMP